MFFSFFALYFLKTCEIPLDKTPEKVYDINGGLCGKEGAQH